MRSHTWDKLKKPHPTEIVLPTKELKSVEISHATLHTQKKPFYRFHFLQFTLIGLNIIVRLLKYATFKALFLRSSDTKSVEISQVNDKRILPLILSPQETFLPLPLSSIYFDRFKPNCSIIEKCDFLSPLSTFFRHKKWWNFTTDWQKNSSVDFVHSW